MKECDGRHGKYGCLDPRWIDERWECIGQMANALIEAESDFLMALKDAGEQFGDWKGGA